MHENDYQLERHAEEVQFSNEPSSRENTKPYNLERTRFSGTVRQRPQESCCRCGDVAVMMPRSPRRPGAASHEGKSERADN
jgi:hypothetical protein